jgi:hypothetical protein
MEMKSCLLELRHGGLVVTWRDLWRDAIGRALLLLLWIMAVRFGLVPAKKGLLMLNGKGLVHHR